VLCRLLRFAAAGWLVALLGPTGAWADDGGGLAVGGLLDVRAIRTGDAQDWLHGGFGKLRYGSTDGRPATLLRVSQASFLLAVPVGDFVSAHVQLNGETNDDVAGQGARVGLTQAFVDVRAEPGPRVRLRGRVGLFFPPVSLEADGPAWTGPYTITPSAATSWIADEVRTVGAEARVAVQPEKHELAVSASVYGYNDPTGSLLAWRGWALGDRQTMVGDRLPLPPLYSISSAGVFPRQAPWVQPLREIDGRPGYSIGASWSAAGAFELRAFHYDNRAEQTEIYNGQYAWHTRFDSAAVRVRWRAFELLGQYLSGTTLMGPVAEGRPLVDAPFRTAFGMASAVCGRHRLTARYDDFEVQDRDVHVIDDPNAERGHAWTAAYAFRIGESHRLAVEVLRVRSDRAARATLGLPTREDETQAQASLRLKF
jgi:hypothetical protein